MNTRKHPRTHSPRTLEEAFGPYARGPISEPHQPMPTADLIVVLISVAAGVAILAMVMLGWMPGGAA